MVQWGALFKAQVLQKKMENLQFVKPTIKDKCLWAL